MSTETAVVKREETSIADLKTVSQLFAESGYFPDAKSMAQAFVKIRAGEEMGIPAMAAMTGIAIIQGKPVAGANIIAAKVKMSGYDYRIRHLDNTGCSIEFFNNKGESLGTSTFDEADARAAGLAAKDNWRKYPRNMYFARAMGNGQKWYCPDATLGMVIYTPDELGGKVDEDGNPVIDKSGEVVVESLSEIIDEKNKIDAPPARPEPPPEAYTDAPAAETKPAARADELTREGDIDMIYTYIDRIIENAGGTRGQWLIKLSEFTNKKTKEFVPGIGAITHKISDARIKVIKHEAHKEADKYPEELPF